MTKKIGAGLLSCADKIWETADTLRGAGIKASEWPAYMMPFFALMMLESRLRRFRQARIEEFRTEVASNFRIEDPSHMEWLEYAAKAANKGNNRDLLLHGKGLRETCLVPGGNFLTRLLTHLEQYDPDTKRLLGIGYAQGHAKFLDMQGKASDLFSRDNCPLFPFAQKWASIDLTPFDNSEITTIEEHIKRKWADISAETAGEQYTPSDVIDLATAIIVELRREGSGGTGIADVYDMASGGGNFLFATEDALREAFPELSVRTRGQELNDALYALAAIEARFREDARIEWGNTLTNDLFLHDKFDAIVANPPYGVDWKDIKKTLELDASGRFDKNRMPPTPDGQLLFLQHAAFHLSETGVATIVHSGSTLFSGDAGGGESETRRFLIQEQDIVEAIIQLPRNEFFNTGIHTYLWVLNRAKPTNRKGFVLLINAENCFTKIKPSLNQKTCAIDETNRARIVEAFCNFADGPITRKLRIDALLYNKVELELWRHDELGRAIGKSKKIEGEKIAVHFDGDVFSVGDGLLDLAPFGEITIKEIVAQFNEAARSAEQTAVDVKGGPVYRRNNETGAIVIDSLEKGLGVLTAKAKIAKSKGLELVKVDIVLDRLVEKDSEIVAYSEDETINNQLIASFLARWVPEPWCMLGTKTGCEIGFNPLFPKVSEIRMIKDILKEIAAVEEEMVQLEAEIAANLSDVHGAAARPIAISEFEWIGASPSHWSIERIKDHALDMQRGAQPQYADETGHFIANQACLSTYSFRPEKRKECEPLTGKKGRYLRRDILIASTGEGVLGKCVLVDHEGYADSHVSILRLKHQQTASFLNYLLSVNYELINSRYAKGSTKQTELQRERFLAHPISVPPKEEQIAITAFLDRELSKIDAQLELINRFSALLKEQRKSIIYEAVTGKIDLSSVEPPANAPMA
ncbi:MAG: N-6 DNA methylase [Polaromonas sp.]|uniref:N-6 DNA methylase n=1 Tax=Polaromonas sp. TaxID=1869339 RepID=UPI00179FF5E1|nr:N-6 DNA methylase [Polaromonas sp.]NMM08705.1 N-6 DNA methylase [Polaromonas sp.]